MLKGGVSPGSHLWSLGIGWKQELMLPPAGWLPRLQRFQKKGHFTYNLGHQATLTHLQGPHLPVPLQKGSLTQGSSLKHLPSDIWYHFRYFKMQTPEMKQLCVVAVTRALVPLPLLSVSCALSLTPADIL